MKAAINHTVCLTGRPSPCAAHRQRRLQVQRAPRLTSSLRDDTSHAADGAADTAADAAIDQPIDDTGAAQGRDRAIPRVLLVDPDPASAEIVTALLMPEASVVHAPTIADARRLLGTNIFVLVIIDPALPDGDAGALVAMLADTPVVVYAAREPRWRDHAAAFLPKPWTTPRELWSTISRLLGVPTNMTAGD